MPLYCAVFLAFENLPLVLERFYYTGGDATKATLLRAVPLPAPDLSLHARRRLRAADHAPVVARRAAVAGRATRSTRSGRRRCCRSSTSWPAVRRRARLRDLRPADLLPALLAPARHRGARGARRTCCRCVCLVFLVVRFGDLAWRGQLGAAFALDSMSLCSCSRSRSSWCRRSCSGAGPRARRRGSCSTWRTLACLGGMIYRFVPTTIAFNPGRATQLLPGASRGADHRRLHRAGDRGLRPGRQVLRDAAGARSRSGTTCASSRASPARRSSARRQSHGTHLDRSGHAHRRPPAHRRGGGRRRGQQGLGVLHHVARHRDDPARARPARGLGLRAALLRRLHDGARDRRRCAPSRTRSRLEVPPNAQFIRNLILIAHALHDHIVHFYHLSALDWVDVTTIPKADPAKAAAIAAEPFRLAGQLAAARCKKVQDKVNGAAAERPARHLRERLLGPSGDAARARGEPARALATTSRRSTSSARRTRWSRSSAGRRRTSRTSPSAA